MPLVRSALAHSVPAPDGTPSLESAATLDACDAAVRLAAVRCAARRGEAATLAERLPREEDRGVREAILIALTRIGGAAAVGAVVDLLRSEDVFLRNGIIEALQGMPGDIVPELLPLLADADPDVRIFALNVMQAFREHRVAEAAARVVAEDADVNVCSTAVEVLAETGDVRMLAPLRAAQGRFPDHPYFGFAVQAALRRMD